MKNFLCATTALAGLVLAVPQAQAEIDLDVGGYFYGYLGYVDQDNDTNLYDFDWKREAELHFKGETTLDNGLTVGVKVEIETEDDDSLSDDQIDENNIYFAGNWGKLILGSDDNAAYLLQVTAPTPDDLVSGYEPKFRFINEDTDAAFEYNHGQSSDGDKITYITPKFNGFQAGVSYVPTEVGSEEVIGGSLAGMPSDNDTGDYEDFIAAGFRYDGTFEGVGIAFGAGYSTADREVETSGQDSFNEWNIGLKLSYDNISIGAAYNNDNNGLDDNNDDDIYTIGIDYTYGPYLVGFSYFHSERENGTGTVEDEVDRYSLGGQYAYGPGMSFRASANLYDIDDNTPANDQDAISILIGTAIYF